MVLKVHVVAMTVLVTNNSGVARGVALATPLNLNNSVKNFFEFEELKHHLL